MLPSDSACMKMCVCVIHPHPPLLNVCLCPVFCLSHVLQSVCLCGAPPTGCNASAVCHASCLCEWVCPQQQALNVIFRRRRCCVCWMRCVIERFKKTTTKNTQIQLQSLHVWIPQCTTQHTQRWRQQNSSSQQIPAGVTAPSPPLDFISRPLSLPVIIILSPSLTQMTVLTTAWPGVRAGTWYTARCLQFRLWLQMTSPYTRYMASILHDGRERSPSLFLSVASRPAVSAAGCH